MNTSTKLLAVSRREIKYLLTLSDRLYFLNACNQLLTPDTYGDYNGYRVRSVYFDTIDNEDYWAKIHQLNEKKRIRLRVYSPDDPQAKFEMKRKKNGRELKESLVVTREDGRELLKGNYSVLLNYDSEFAEYACGLMRTKMYRPVSMMEYDRRAYTHEHFNTRVTLDNHLRYSTFGYDLFSQNPHFISAMSEYDTILEIKYDRFLFRQIQQALSKCDLSRKPPGKYSSSRTMLKSCYY